MAGKRGVGRCSTFCRGGQGGGRWAPVRRGSLAVREPADTGESRRSGSESERRCVRARTLRKGAGFRVGKALLQSRKAGKLPFLAVRLPRHLEVARHSIAACSFSFAACLAQTRGRHGTRAGHCHRTQGRGRQSRLRGSQGDQGRRVAQGAVLHNNPGWLGPSCRRIDYAVERSRRLSVAPPRSRGSRRSIAPGVSCTRALPQTHPVPPAFAVRPHQCGRESWGFFPDGAESRTLRGASEKRREWTFRHTDVRETARANCKCRGTDGG